MKPAAKWLHNPSVGLNVFLVTDEGIHTAVRLSWQCWQAPIRPYHLWVVLLMLRANLILVTGIVSTYRSIGQQLGYIILLCTLKFLATDEAMHPVSVKLASPYQALSLLGGFPDADCANLILVTGIKGSSGHYFTHLAYREWPRPLSKTDRASVRFFLHVFTFQPRAIGGKFCLHATNCLFFTVRYHFFQDITTTDGYIS